MYNNNPYYGNQSNQPTSFMNESVLDSYATTAWSNSTFLKRSFTQVGKSTIALPTSANSSGVLGSFNLTTNDYTECVYILELSGQVQTSNELNIIVSGFLPSDRLSIANNVTLLDTGLGTFQRYMRNGAYECYLVDDSTSNANFHIVIDYLESSNVNRATLCIPSSIYDTGAGSGKGKLNYRIYGYAGAGITATITVFAR